jgi:hypothetical protein
MASSVGAVRRSDRIDRRRHALLAWVVLAAVVVAPRTAVATTPTPTGRYVVGGRVAEFPAGCQGAQRGVTVVFEPLGRTTQTSLADGSFRFDQVPPGYYTLRVDYCNPFGCWPERPITVAGSDVYEVLCPVADETPTPPATPTQTPPGDLGTKQITGRVYDAMQGSATGIAGAEVEYRRLATLGGGMSGTVATDASGDFAFELFLHDSDTIIITASAEGFAPEELVFNGYGLWVAPPLSIGLLPLGGTVAISPSTVVNLPCEGDGEVMIANADPPGGEALTITEILPSNSYSQGDYGTGFTWDLGAIALPLTLAPGERVGFPVHYGAAGQQFPSRLTVRLRSTARNVDGNFAVPYRGEIEGCAAPTPTPTVLPACAGDCDGDGAVTIEELVRGVAMALGDPVLPCPNADRDADGFVVISELVAAVAAALGGCPAATAP